MDFKTMFLTFSMGLLRRRFTFSSQKGLRHATQRLTFADPREPYVDSNMLHGHAMLVLTIAFRDWASLRVKRTPTSTTLLVEASCLF